MNHLLSAKKSKTDILVGLIIVTLTLMTGLFSSQQTALANQVMMDHAVAEDIVSVRSTLQESEPITEPVIIAAPDISVSIDLDEPIASIDPIADTPETNLTYSLIKLLYVGPDLVDCTGLVPQQCMQVREDPNAPWQNFYSSIEGFTYESGYYYVLQVIEEHVDTSGLSDAPSIRYYLDEIVSKYKVAEIITLYVGPELVDCTGLVPQQCMQVREDLNAPWQNFYDSIEGFIYEPGFVYELSIRKEYHDVSGIADRSSVSYHLEAILSKRPVAVQAQVTIKKVSEPRTKLNFRFSGDLGDFLLDNPAIDDNDGIVDTQTFTVGSGQYTIREQANKYWQVSDIICATTAASTNHFSVDPMRQELTVEISNSEPLECTFISKRAGTIRVQSFDDKNANGRKNRSDKGLPNVTYTLYNAFGQSLAQKTTNNIGRLNFKVAVGVYTICEENIAGRQNTLPGVINATYQQPCHTVTVKAGKQINLFFGSTTGVIAAAVTDNNGMNGIFVVEEVANTANSDEDEGGYQENVTASSDEAVELFINELFLPLVQR